ncbi:NAD-dependent protein deacylase [Bombilactobacillus thymidiniphilus]|uniref:protein acetyllysine N-acetyltransferase n=1 Tax=Bombilactobacillus thymidiniphilus TaxID=2923363 RepID=A0ABY4PFH4_9LACO|nr:NAD-dependent protein deacylase [Bombilactobacillus thymidiniphilus]UQS84337.1 NAD-dependent protein deacylase [Bombilactobacillus thymidiniphilus]
MMELQQLIDQANFVTFMTGAGVSTASGIPDYRSQTGVYAGKQNAEYQLSHDNFVNHPQDFWEFVKTNLYFPEAEPNVIHQKMADIAQRKGMIITQNVDGLDKKLQNENVIEFHGNIYDTYCTKCQQPVAWQQYLQNYQHENCGGLIRPHVVLYGEGIAEQAVQQSVAAVVKADLLIIVGTSFQVYPFAGLLQYRTPNARLVAINKTPLEVGINDVMITGDAVDVFRQINLD